MKKSICILFTLLPIFVCSSAEAEFTKIGSPTSHVDAVRSSDISTTCTYRLRGTLSPTKSTGYLLNYIREQASGTPTVMSYVLEGGISYSELIELTSNQQSLFSGGKPYPNATPTADSADQLRVEVSASAAAVVRVVSRGQLYSLNASYFDLEKECGSFDTLSPVNSTGTPSASCPGLTTRFAANTPCSCPMKFNELTSGENTPCGWLGSQNGECLDGTTTFGGTPGQCQPVKFFGPAGYGLGEAYVFDYRSCSCKLCNPWFYTRSADRRSCECRYSTAADVIAFRNSPPTSPFPGNGPQLPMFPIGGDACTFQANSTVHQWKPNVIFDPAKCTCVTCPAPKYANADHTACIQP